MLVLLGAFTKSAQFPFHFWLPHAMAAPTPVSAYLHSATMVKAGVFLLARLYPALGDSEPWFWIVSAVGLATLTFGAFVAIFQQDLKGLLAYSTISHLGLITLLFGLDSPLAVVAGVFHIMNHAAFKASLFMAAGIIDHETGSRDMRQLNGLWSAMPITATLAMVAAAAMAGVPLLNGFLSKEMFFAETLAVESHRAVRVDRADRGDGRRIRRASRTACASSTTCSSTASRWDLSKTPHEPPRWMRIPVEVLVVVCIVVGVLPAVTVGPLLAVAARATLGGALPDYSLALWHGFNLPLAMSAVALVAGIVAYFTLQRTINLHSVTRLPVNGKHVFDAAVAAVARVASALTAALPFGAAPRHPGVHLRRGDRRHRAAAAARRVGGARRCPDRPGRRRRALAGDRRGLFAVGAAAAIGTAACYRRRFLALVLLGTVGLMVSLAFVLLSAPDLALTQLLVEVVTILLMLLVLHYLPADAPVEPRPARKLVDAALAGVAGAGAAAIAWAVMTRPFDSISPYYLARSLPEGGGSNAVNVIIVDFRGFDTLGEITVLGIAGLIVFALLSRFRVPSTFVPVPADPGWNPLLLQVVTRTLLPLAAMVSVYLFLRGHNLPGGGFIAGLVLAAAVMIVRVAGGSALPAAADLGYAVWIGAGLLIAGLTGVFSAAFGHPFLTSSFGHPVLPVIGELPLATAAVFDLGVYLTVVGATLLALMSPALLRTADPGSGR